MMHVSRNLGIPLWEDEADADADLDLFGQLRLAGSRSMKAQAFRNRQR